MHDGLFLYSEGGRNVPVYQCSHSRIYGNRDSLEIEEPPRGEEISPYEEHLLQERRFKAIRLQADKTLLQQKEALGQTQKLSRELFDPGHANQHVKNEERRLFRHALMLQ